MFLFQFVTVHKLIMKVKQKDICTYYATSSLNVTLSHHRSKEPMSPWALGMYVRQIYHTHVTTITYPLI